MLKQAIDAVRTKLDSVEAWFVPGVTMLDLKRSCQLDRFSCGAQCVSMILSVFGKKVYPETVLVKLNPWNTGVGPTRIRKFLNKYGLKVKRKNRATIMDIRGAILDGSPVLLCAKDGGHWIVAFGTSKSRMAVADPSICWRSLWTWWSNEKLEAYRDRVAYIISKEER